MSNELNLKDKTYIHFYCSPIKIRFSPR